MGYKFLPKIDLSMQYYMFKLDDSSKELMTFATPFGLFHYKCFPMGINSSPDIAQNIMEKVLKDISSIEIYIDDIVCFSNSWESHLVTLLKMFAILDAKGFSTNPLKCEWGLQETGFLGHWITSHGIKPWDKKAKTISAWTNRKQQVNYVHFWVLLLTVETCGLHERICLLP